MTGTPPEKQRSSHHHHARDQRRGERPSKSNNKKKEATAPATATATNHLGHVSRIPWTKQETDHVQELLEFLAGQLKEKNNTKIPHKESKLLLRVIQEFLAQDDLDRNDPLLSKIAYYFNEVQCVDLDKVARLIQGHKDMAATLEDQDVILLLGGPSSGKTTTLHCLAGTTFQEAEVDGFVHLKPTQFLDGSVAGFETSSGRTPITKALQTCTVNMHDHNYIVCDTPGSGFTRAAAGELSIEEEIAHSHGLVEAICRARTIRPVFVLSQECLGTRMSGFPQLFSTMNTYFNLEKAMTYNDLQSEEGSDGIDVPGSSSIPFQYVFTRFDDRSRTRLCKMFNHFREMAADAYDDEDDEDDNDEDTREIFEQVVDDIVEKTTPEATIVNPINDIPRYLLRTLLENDKAVCAPRDWMKPFAQESVKALLHAQLKLTLYGILMFLANQDYPSAVERVQNLKALSEVLVDAKEYYEMAIKACKRYAILLWETFQDSMEDRDFGSGFAHVTQSLQLSAAIPEMDGYIRLSHQDFWDKLTDITVKSKVVISHSTVRQMREMTKYDPGMSGEIKRGIRVVRNSILKDFDRDGEDITKACLLLMQLVQLSNAFKEAAQGSVDLLDALENRLMELIKEQDFRNATKDLVAMGRLTQEFPSETKFAHFALKMFKHALELAIEKNSYDAAGDLLLDMTQLQVYYPPAEKFLNRGLEKLWKTFGYAIKQREYVTAVCVIKHMSKVAHVSATAYDRSRLGIEVIRDRLFKTIQSKNYGTAQVLLQQLNKLEKMLPKSMKPKDSGDIPFVTQKKQFVENKLKTFEEEWRHESHESPIPNRHQHQRSSPPSRKPSPPREDHAHRDVRTKMSIEEGTAGGDMSELTMSVSGQAQPQFPMVIKAMSSRPSNLSSKKEQNKNKNRHYPQTHALEQSPYPSKHRYESPPPVEEESHYESPNRKRYESTPHRRQSRYESPEKSRCEESTVERRSYAKPQSSSSRLSRGHNDHDEEEYGESMFSNQKETPGRNSIQKPSPRPQKVKNHLVGKTFRNSYTKSGKTGGAGMSITRTPTSRHTASSIAKGGDATENTMIMSPASRRHHDQDAESAKQHSSRQATPIPKPVPVPHTQSPLQVHSSSNKNQLTRKDRLEQVNTMLTSVLTGNSWE